MIKCDSFSQRGESGVILFFVGLGLCGQASWGIGYSKKDDLLGLNLGKNLRKHLEIGQF